MPSLGPSPTLLLILQIATNVDWPVNSGTKAEALHSFECILNQLLGIWDVWYLERS